jgi:hypothetical protein
MKFYQAASGEEATVASAEQAASASSTWRPGRERQGAAVGVTQLPGGHAGGSLAAAIAEAGEWRSRRGLPGVWAATAGVGVAGRVRPGGFGPVFWSASDACGAGLGWLGPAGDGRVYYRSDS